MIQKHLAYLLVNIGNEVGSDEVTSAAFVAAYSAAVARLRAASLHHLLVIDAPDWGKNLAVLDAAAAPLLAADPDHNLLFSLHPYWPRVCSYDAPAIRARLQHSVDLVCPLILGKFSAYGGDPQSRGRQQASICSAEGEVDYQTLLAECDRNEIGWLAWEWGLGNVWGDPLCGVMDMTPDCLFAHLKPGWASEVALTSPYSIQNTSVTPPGME